MQQEAALEEGQRKLTMVVVVWLIIALHLYTTLSQGAVLAKLARRLRFIWPDPTIRLPGDSALSYRPTQLGARPLFALFHQLCQPIATSQTRGAFLFGLRLMALDGLVEDVPDTPANAAYFGRHTSARSIQEALSVAQQLHWLSMTWVCQLALADVEQTDYQPQQRRHTGALRRRSSGRSPIN